MKQLLLAMILVAVPVALFGGYEIYSASIVTAAPRRLGDLGNFKVIISDVQKLAEKGDIPAAAKRITDFETAWDQAETAIRPLNQTEWGNIDLAADGALKAVRAANPQPSRVQATLATLMAELNDPSKAP
jgi:hypothetical protein